MDYNFALFGNTCDLFGRSFGFVYIFIQSIFSVIRTTIMSCIVSDFMLEMKTAQEKQLKVMETRIRQADEDRDEALMELENSIKTKTHQRYVIF